MPRGRAIPGFPPGLVNGTIHVADAVALQAKTDLVTAYNDAAGRLPALAIPADLGGLTLTSGVYKSASSLGLTGALTLDAQGNPNAVFVFQAGSTLTTASASRVNLINGAQAVQRLLAGRQLRDARDHHQLLRRHPGHAVDLDQQRGHGAGARVRPQRRRHDDQRQHQRRALHDPHGRDAAGRRRRAGRDRAGRDAGPDASNGSALFTTTPRSVARSIAQFGTGRCVSRNFQTYVRGIAIKRVVFSLDGRFLTTRNRAPFGALISAGDGVHNIRARVTFTDTTPPATLNMLFRTCAEVQQVAPSRPARGTSGFTG